MQVRLFESNHPSDCTRAPILLCSTAVHKFQGAGSRLFYLGCCLAEGLNTGRVVVLTNELGSTLDILRPFKPWSNCTLKDVRLNKLKAGIRRYFPMDSSDLRKTPEMPAVGALYPNEFKKNGYWWWKAQEITYALRPSDATNAAFIKKQDEFGWNKNLISVFQIRRTDKTEGCSKIYGIPIFYI